MITVIIVRNGLEQSASNRDRSRDLKTAQINGGNRLIKELNLYEFKLGYKNVETSKNIYLSIWMAL